MKKAFTLPTCTTCQKIFDDLSPEKNGCKIINIKVEGISPADIDSMKDLAGSYEALFSRRAMKFRSMGLADKKLSEMDYRALMIGEYTFLKRPVFLFENAVTIGSRKVEIERARKLLG